MRCGFLPPTLPSSNESSQLKDLRIVGEVAAGQSQFGEGVFVVSVTAVEMFRQGKVRFAGFGPQTQSGLDSRVRQCKARRRVIAPEKVNEVMRFSQSAISKEEHWVSRDRLFEQLRGLEKII